MKRTLSAAGLSRKDMNGRAEGGNFPCGCGPERILVKPDSRREFTSDLDAVTKPPPSGYRARFEVALWMEVLDVPMRKRKAIMYRTNIHKNAAPGHHVGG